MAGYKVPDFNERTAAARAAKQAALDNLRNRPAPDPAVVAERQAAATAREAAAAERRAVKLAAKEAEAANAAQSVATSDEKTPEPAAPSAEAPPVERPQLTDAELKAARDARYAARKKRKR